MKTTIPETFQVYPEILWNTNDLVITNIATEESVISIQWENVVLFGGMFLASLFFGYKLYQIFALRRKGKVYYFKDFTQVIIANSAMAFSFFKSIFLGDKITTSEYQSIVEHELVHIRQRHSYDLLFFEVMRIVGWFNPLVYVYQRRVSELHEFIADAHVSKTNKKAQYEFLLSQVFQTQNISFINQFFKSSLIKKRIVMLQKSKSKKIYQLKYLLLLPLVFGMLAYTSVEYKNESFAELDYFIFDSDEKLIAEIEKEIELEFQEKGTWQLTLFSFYHKISLNGNDDQILSKRDYFKRYLLFAKVVEYEDGKDKNQVKENMPSSTKYKAYVKRESGLRILDENLKKRIVSNKKSKITPIDKATIYKDEQFVYEVESIEKLTSEELSIVDQKISQIIIKTSPDHKSIVLTDSKYAFNIDSNQGDLDFLASLDRLDSDKKIQIKKNDKKTDPVPFAKVDEVPVFPGCEDVENKRNCFNEMIQEHISKYFSYPKEAQEKGIQGRVNVLFIISKKGKIEGLRMRGPDFLLEKEVARIIGKLPKMKPGKHKGKKVDVPFSIPVTFKLKGEDAFEILPIDSNRFGPKVAATLRQYNQLVVERKRLLKSSNEKNPIIVNLDEHLRSLKESLSKSLNSSVNSLTQGYIKRRVEDMSKENTASKYNQLVEERKRLLQSSNEKNPIIVNLDQEIKALKEHLDQESETVPFATIDEVPVFPGCEDADNKRKCFSKKMHEHIAKHFTYPKDAQEKGIQGRVAVMFTIAKNGSIDNIRKRGPDVLLENEAVRIIEKLPKMKPGKRKGKTVNVPFSIPINFKLNENDNVKSLINLKSDKGLEFLYIVDGIETPKEKAMKLIGNSGDLVESIYALTGDSANKKYGEKGKNGVIEITTKKKE